VVKAPDLLILVEYRVRAEQLAIPESASV
jgi:hypothetical protein